MGIGFRKRVKIAPGVTFNLSKKGVSTTIGAKGASVNIGKNGVYTNASIPGSGIYSRNKIASTSRTTKSEEKKNTPRMSLPVAMILWIIVIIAFLITFLCSD